MDSKANGFFFNPEFQQSRGSGRLNTWAAGPFAGNESPGFYFAFMATRSCVAAASEDAGFCPVISSPSLLI